MATGARHRRRPEGDIQRAVFQHLRARGAPGVFAFAVPNGGYRTPVEAAIFKGIGVVAGVPDVIAIHEGRVYALELKAEGGRATPKQQEAIAAMEAAGAFTAIAEGLGRALAVLEAWGLLRGTARSTPLVYRDPLHRHPETKRPARCGSTAPAQG
jgi:hypothetical protein